MEGPNQEGSDLLGLGEMATDAPAPGQQNGWVSAILDRGRRLFDAGQYDQAKMRCAEALDVNPNEAAAYELLGAVYSAEGNRKLARDMYQEAKRLRSETTDQSASPLAQPPPAPKRTSSWRRLWIPAPLQLRYSVLIAGLGSAVLMLGLAPLVSGEPTIFGVNPAQLLLAGAAALLAGSALAASGLIRTFDQELMGPALVSGTSWPLWLFLLTAGALSAWLGMLVYVLSASATDSHSRTEAFFLLTVGAIALIIALGCRAAADFLWLGVNVIFEGVLLGWAAGSMISPREWWRDEERERKP